MTQPPCKRCLLAQIDPQGVAESVRRRIAALPEEEKTDPAEYQQRLAHCTACDMLTDGLCGICGCYVELRAAKSALHCPQSPPFW